MPEAKTKPTRASVTDYLAAIDDPKRRADCEALVTLMRKDVDVHVLEQLVAGSVAEIKRRHPVE